MSHSGCRDTSQAVIALNLRQIPAKEARKLEISQANAVSFGIIRNTLAGKMMTIHFVFAWRERAN